jgi:hypothetical protein
MIRKYLRRRVLALAVAGVALLPIATVQAAPKTAPTTAGSQYVALGSSFAAGPGIPTTIDPGCIRSDSNYPHLVAGSRALNLTDVTCSGATINNVVDTPQQTQAGPKPPQVAAVNADTDLVTITVGGNDAFYLSTLNAQSCANDPAPMNNAVAPLPEPLKTQIRASFCTLPNLAAVQAALDGMEAELIAMINTARSASPNARILLVDYATILPQNGQPCAGLPLTKDQIKSGLKIAQALQLATKHAAQQAGAELVEWSKATRGHDVCSQDPWMFKWQDTRFAPTPVAPYHPTLAGMQSAASLIASQIS